MLSNEEKKDPTLKHFKHVLIALLIVMALVWFTRTFSPCPSQFDMKYYYQPSYNGLIVKKYIREMSHGSQYLDFIDKNLPMVKFCTDNAIYEHASIGDSIFKEANSLDLRLKKANGEVMFFPYICP
jgi:hypothetical protein